MNPIEKRLRLKFHSALKACGPDAYTLKYGALENPDHVWITWFKGGGVYATVEKVYDFSALSSLLDGVTPVESKAALKWALKDAEVLSAEMPAHLQTDKEPEQGPWLEQGGIDQ